METTHQPDPPDDLDTYPDLLTVAEAARYLRISRTLGYQLARRYRMTDGDHGLPVIRLGRCLRVPRRELAKLVAASPVSEND